MTGQRKMMTGQKKLGGEFTLPGTSTRVRRMGYGAMQLAGPGVWGPPSDPDAAVAVLREAIALGVNHIDTSDYYGPHATNQFIRRALYPYPPGLIIVTKVGYRRGDDQSWLVARSEKELIAAVHDNLRNLRVDTLDVVNLRFEGREVSAAAIQEPLAVLAKLKDQGLIRHLGLSNISQRQFSDAQQVTPIIGVQNQYNLANRQDDSLVDELARVGVAYTPFFPLGGFSPLQSATLTSVAEMLGATPLQTALAWLLQRSPNILLIPGTSSLGHLRENIEAAKLQLTPDAIAQLDTIGAGTVG